MVAGVRQEVAEKFHEWIGEAGLEQRLRALGVRDIGGLARRRHVDRPRHGELIARVRAAGAAVRKEDRHA